MTSNSTPVSRPSFVTALRNWPWRPIFACGGALLIGSVLAPIGLKPPTAETKSETIDWQIALPATSTLIVRPMPQMGQAAKGQVRLVSDVVGTAPIGGEVARWLVEPGTRVEKGQPVVEISSGQSSRVPLRAEAAQSAAEKNQIAASNAQLALAQQLSTSQIKLRAAQDRVDRAQKRVAETREIIQKLQRGEEVHLSGPIAPVPAAPAAPSRAQRAAEKALATATAAQEASKQAAGAATAAKSDVEAAEKSLKDAQALLKDAQAAQEKAEDLFDSGRGVGSQVQDARNAVADAKTAIARATTRLETAQKAVTARTTEAAKAETTAKSAADEAKKLAANVPAVAPEVPAPQVGSSVSLEQASQLVDEALTESRRATREAERLHGQVEDYQRQVRYSQNRIKNASENLKDAQQHVLDSVPRPQFTSATATADGTVIWIARLAREVAPGDSVFGLAQGQRYRAFVEDHSSAWKQVRTGQTLPALVVLGKPAAEKSNEAAPTATPSAQTTPKTALASQSAIKQQSSSLVANLVVTKVSAPEEEGAPAVIEGEIQSGTPTPLEQGMTVLASLPDQKKTATTTLVSVPVSAIVERGNSHFVATLEAVTETAPPNTATNGTSMAPSTASASATPASATPVKAMPAPATGQPPSLQDAPVQDTPNRAAPTAVAATGSPSPGPSGTTPSTTTMAGEAPTPVSQQPTMLYHLRWREVQLGSGDLLHFQVRSGLKTGERIITDPQPLLAQISPEEGVGPLVRLSLD